MTALGVDRKGSALFVYRVSGLTQSVVTQSVFQTVLSLSNNKYPRGAHENPPPHRLDVGGDEAAVTATYCSTVNVAGCRVS